MGVEIKSSGAAPAVEVDPGKSPGLARLSAFLMDQAIKKNPQIVTRMRGSLAMKVEGLNAGETIRFERGRVTITGVVDPNASIVIEAPLLMLGALNQTGNIARGLVRREIKIKGALRHPLLLLRLRRLMQSR